MIYLLIVFLSFASVGWAEHLVPGTETADCNQRNHWCGQTLGHDEPAPTLKESADWTRKLMAGTITCLDRMEAAMRAMEPFLDGSRHINLLKTEAEKEAYFRDKPAAYALWQSTKRECWSTP